MIIVTINEEKTDGSKSIWTLKVSGDGLNAQSFIGIVAGMCVNSNFKLELEPLKLKG